MNRRSRNGRFAQNDREPMTAEQRAARKQAMAELQAKMKADQLKRHAEFNASMQAVNQEGAR
jgi:putative heme iron utilization protein